MSSSELLEKYQNILEKNGITDPIRRVDVTDSGAKGDGMASVTQFVTVTFKREEVAPLHLFVKSHTDNPTHEEMLQYLKAFEKEWRFFMEYLPDAKQLCKDNGMGELIDFLPKCYYADESIIVLENLVVRKGYSLLPHDGHDFNTARIVLKALGKHHAISHGLIQATGGREKFFQKYPNLDYDGLLHPKLVDMVEGQFANGYETCQNVLKKHQIKDQEQYLNQLKVLAGSETFRDVVCTSLRIDSAVEPVLLLNHGDFKGNNMMFRKTESDDESLHFVAVDLQGTRYDTPAMDLSVYLFTTVKPSVRQTRLHELLEIYRVSLNEISEKLKYPINLTSEVLFSIYQRKCKFSFWYAMALVGPGMSLFKEIDVDTVDMGDFANVYQRLLLQWIQKNPHKGYEMAEQYAALIKEYESLRQT